MAEGFGKDIRKNSPRVNELKKRVKGLIDPDSIMMEILEVFRETEFIPDVGKYYTFIYIAKTPNIRFDIHPLIACIDVQRWGFRGLNFHWGTVRNYTWQEVAGPLHIVRNDEIEYLRSLPYARFLKS
jgi:hypothetical protein